MVGPAGPIKAVRISAIRAWVSIDSSTRPGPASLVKALCMCVCAVGNENGVLVCNDLCVNKMSRLERQKGR